MNGGGLGSLLLICCTNGGGFGLLLLSSVTGEEIEDVEGGVAFGILEVACSLLVDAVVVDDDAIGGLYGKSDEECCCVT